MPINRVLNSYLNFNMDEMQVTTEKAKYAVNNNGLLGEWINEVKIQKDSNSKIMLSTGASNAFCKQGIYDLAGNTTEWTLEHYSNTSNLCNTRGSSYYFLGDERPANFRVAYEKIVYSNNFGFRVSIY